MSCFYLQDKICKKYILFVVAQKLCEVGTASYRTVYKLPWFRKPPSYQEEVPEHDEEKEKAAAGNCVPRNILIKIYCFLYVQV